MWPKQTLEILESATISSPLHLLHVHKCNYQSFSDLYQKLQQHLIHLIPLPFGSPTGMTSKICLRLWLPPQIKLSYVEGTTFSGVSLVYFDHPTKVHFAHSI